MLPQESVCGVLSPVCGVVGGVVGGAGGAAADAVLAGIGGAFVVAAQQVAEVAFAALDATTDVNLTASWFTKNVAVLAAIAVPVVVGLFALQVIGSVLRREPGGLGRAVVGVGKATLGASLAIAITQLALVATDGVCRYIAASAGTSVHGAVQRFLVVSWLSGGVGPILQMLLGLAIIIGSLLLWSVLLFRKAAVLLVAVFAPVAFAGSVWDQTQTWMRKWIEVMTSLVLCKIVIVVVFVVGLSAFGGDGSTTSGSKQSTVGSLSDVLVGLLLLSIAVFAPWLTWRFVHWSGIEAGTSLHGAVASSPVPGAIRSSASQTRFMVQSAATSAMTGGAGAAGAVGARAAAQSVQGASAGTRAGTEPMADAR